MAPRGRDRPTAACGHGPRPGRVGVERLEGVGIVEALGGVAGREGTGPEGDLGRVASSGVASSRRRLRAAEAELAARPGDRIASTRPRIVGLIQRNSEVASAKAAIRPPAERGVPAMAGDDVAHRDRAVVAPLRVPAGVAPEQDAHHRAGLDHHRHRGDQGREQDLDQARQDQPAGAAAGPAHRAVHRAGSGPGPSGQQHRHGQAEQLERADRVEPRKDRREPGTAEIIRPLVAVCRTRRIPTTSWHSQSGRRGSRRCRWPKCWRVAGAGRRRRSPVRAGGCPAPSAGRAPRRRSRGAGSPRRSPAGGAACRPPSPPGGSGRLDENRGTGCGRRRAVPGQVRQAAGLREGAVRMMALWPQ